MMSMRPGPRAASAQASPVPLLPPARGSLFDLRPPRYTARMKTKPLGSTGVQVSELCFGTMSFGGDADEAASAALYKACRDAGINFFDTADAYSKGRSEEILGRLMQGHRDDLVVATKVFNPTGDDVNARGASRRHVTRALEASLRRLQTDRVDVLYLHQFDARTPIEEAMRALEDAVRAGKVLYPALSNWSAWQTQKAIDVEERMGWARVQLVQPMYNLVKRQAEVEILPMAQANGVGVAPYSPAAAGLLSGKYAAGGTAAAGRLKANKMYEARYGEAWMFEVAEKYAAFCRQRGLHPVSAAVAWVGAHPAVTAPIIGARNTEQLKDSLAAVKVDMTPALRAEIAALSRTPPPATDRLEEQKPPKA
jgi:aryl-alcohol dehydrogenase-like predicted oxidoreductase